MESREEELGCDNLTSQSQPELDWRLKKPKSHKLDGPWPHPVVPQAWPRGRQCFAVALASVFPVGQH